MMGPTDLSLTTTDPDDLGPDFDPDDELAAEWKISLVPFSFSCNVCRLELDGVGELAAAALSTAPTTVQARDLGPDFDPDREAERLAGNL
ncbi:hypothetical protein [Nocardia testacea]|uniref:hypothetical protein n=1 Tax=Nocardia testacea TaxID=248551 RepID=UPI0033F53EED